MSEDEGHSQGDADSDADDDGDLVRFQCHMHAVQTAT